MKKGTRLVIIEFREGDLPEGPPEQIQLSKNEIIAMVSNAGFSRIAADNKLLPYQNLLEFKKQ